MKPAPVISVLMAVHDGQAYLAEAVESILQQTFTDFEFLIINDGSTDGSAAILADHAERDPRIRVISQANMGLTKSLNIGIGHARGEFVARFDADDVSLPDRFQRQVEAFRSNDALVLLGSGVELITADGLPLGVHGHALDHDEIRRVLLLGGGGALTHPSVMMRRSALVRVGGYDETFPVAQDLDLFLRLSEVGEVANLPETLLLWRQHDSSVNRTRSHLWAPLVSRAVEATISRIGPGRYVEALFYRMDQPGPLTDPLELGARAEAGGRYRSAVRLYARGLGTAGKRTGALKRIFRLSARRAARAVWGA